MKVWELGILIGIAAILLIGSAYFYRFSSTFLSSNTVNANRLSEFIDSGKELHLSSEETKKLIQLEFDAAEHHNKGMGLIQQSFRHFSEFLFIIGIAQITLCFLLYKRMMKLKHNRSVELTE